MRSKKPIIIIIIVIIVIAAIIGGVTLFLNNLKKDQKETQKIMRTVIESYDTFEDKVLNFNDIRNTVYTIIYQDTYYDVINENYANFNTQMKKLEDSVDEIDNSISNLEKYCDNYYTSSDVMTKCNSFKDLYEEAINSFVTDVNKYNKILENYNNYSQESGINNKLELYQTSKEYIDYNKDNEYSGKE